MNAVINFLKNNGYKKMPWKKCPQGYEKSNYQCFSHEDKNIWCELYLTDTPPYGWVIGAGIGAIRGKFFNTLTELKTILK